MRKPPRVQYLLEQGPLADIKRNKRNTERHLQYQWAYFSELAHQRNQIHDQIKEALVQSSVANYEFTKWQRTVKWKYGLHPLSTVGSLTFVGGRFNAGVDINPAVPSFPALYLATDKDTALQETFGQIPEGSRFTARELALSNPQSEVTVSVSGQLEKVFDLRKAKNLRKFFGLIKSFKLSAGLKALARQIGAPPPTVVRDVNQLLETLLAKEWRIQPTNWDVPSNPQIFGHLVFQAGIEGILYPSTLTSKDCLAVFPANFAVTSSFVSLDDEPPHANVPRRVDANNWRLCSLSPHELLDFAAVNKTDTPT